MSKADEIGFLREGGEKESRGSETCMFDAALDKRCRGTL
jgi:hypothetical protein